LSVDTVVYRPAIVPAESHFLVVSALVPHKRIDLAIDARRHGGARQRIPGDGPARDQPQRGAGTGAALTGPRTNEEIRDTRLRAHAGHVARERHVQQTRAMIGETITAAAGTRW
jgi:hypothetical protein